MYLVAFAGMANADTKDLPQWAFPDSELTTPPPDDGSLLTLPESNARFTSTDLRNFFSPPDWYPQDHPKMPPLVAKGEKPSAFACGFCHLPTGLGRPENAPIAGLPASYIIRQVKEMASGVRQSARPHRYPQALMTQVASQAATHPGLAEAAAYFAALKYTSTSKVIEADTIPMITISHWILRKSDEDGTEPIGNRLVEIPDDYDRFLLRDGRLTYTTYVPTGSLAKGKNLVTTGGNGKTIACDICHGSDLKGLGFVPPIAGRGPSYIARQLFDMREGARKGEGAALMNAVVEKLSNDDIIAITAYVSSRDP